MPGMFRNGGSANWLRVSLFSACEVASRTVQSGDKRPVFQTSETVCIVEPQNPFGANQNSHVGSFEVPVPATSRKLDPNKMVSFAQTGHLPRAGHLKCGTGVPKAIPKPWVGRWLLI